MPSRHRYQHSCSVPRERPHTHLLTAIYCGELVWSPRVGGRVGSKWGGDELPSLKEKTNPNTPARPQPKHPDTHHCGGVPPQPCRGCHLDFKRQHHPTTPNRAEGAETRQSSSSSPFIAGYQQKQSKAAYGSTAETPRGLSSWCGRARPHSAPSAGPAGSSGSAALGQSPR